jgi:phage terminase small subunit
MAFSVRRQRFVEEYLIDFNATQAAIRAGYSEKTATKIASEMLTKPDVQLAIQQEQAKLRSRVEVTQESVIAELAKIGFADIRKAVKWGPALGEVVIGDDVVQTNGVLLVNSNELDDRTAAAISEISQTTAGIKIKMHDKQKALVDLGRHLGIFEIDNKQKSPLQELSRETLQAIKDKLINGVK